MTDHQANLMRMGVDMDVVTVATITPNPPYQIYSVNLRERGLSGSQGLCLLPYSTLATILHHHCASVPPNLK